MSIDDSKYPRDIEKPRVHQRKSGQTIVLILTDRSISLEDNTKLELLDREFRAIDPARSALIHTQTQAHVLS